MADVFISYKREDRHVVDRLSSALEQVGFEVWWDFELLSGDSFGKVIRAVIDQCHAAVVLWSVRSVESSYVLDEASYARRLGKLCPARIDQTELPFGFGQTHVNDLSDWDGELSHTGFQALVRAVEERVGRRARLGTGASRHERATALAELEAFKAAEIAGTSNALRSFVASFPKGAFAAFVRGQIETMEADAAAARSGSSPTPGSARADASAAEPGAAPSASATAPPRNRLRWQLAAVMAAALAIGLLAVNEVHKREQEGARTARAKENPVPLTASQTRQPDGTPAAESAGRDPADGARDAAAFNIVLLHSDVRAAVDAARSNAQRAEGAAVRARAAATAAESAAQRASNGAAGTVSLALEFGTYLGEGSGEVRSGYGVYSQKAPSRGAGDRYAGQYRDNARNGVGVSTYAKNADNIFHLLRREGEYANNKSNGDGVLFWISGDRFAGSWRDGQISGPGVTQYSDGRRYEGEFASGNRNGHGVLWSAEGRVLSSGIWKEGTLITPLAP